MELVAEIACRRQRVGTPRQRLASTKQRLREVCGPKRRPLVRKRRSLNRQIAAEQRCLNIAKTELVTCQNG